MRTLARFLCTSGAAGPVRVELFFTPPVRDRVAESHLGETAEVVTLASGYTRVVLKVGGWKELVPWILGWGPEVEVVSPPEYAGRTSPVCCRVERRCMEVSMPGEAVRGLERSQSGDGMVAPIQALRQRVRTCGKGFSLG